MIRWLLYRFIPYYVVLFGLLGMGLLVCSEWGLRLIWQQVQPMLPPNLQIQTLEGRIIDKIRIKGLNYSDDSGLSVHAGELWLEWNPLALLSGQILIEDVFAADVNIALPASSAPSDDSPTALPEHLPRLPNWAIKQLRLRQFILTQSETLLSIERADLSAAMQDQQLSLDLSEFQSPQYGQWTAQLAGRIQAHSISLFNLDLQESSGMTLGAKAECRWPSLDCQADLNWNSLQWPLDEGRWFSPQGMVSVQRSGTAIEAKGQLDVHGDGVPFSHIDMALDPQGEDHALSVKLTSEAGNAALSGRLDAALQTLQAHAQLQNLNAEFWQADFPSALNAQMDFAFLAPGRLDITDMTVDGTLREYPLKLRGKVRYSPDEFEASQIVVDIGDTELRANLARKATWKGRVTLDSKDLDTLHPDLRGQLQLALQLNGTPERPEVNWLLGGQSIAFRDTTLESLASKGEWKRNRLGWHLQLNDLKAGGADVSRLELTTSGSPEFANSILAIRSSLGDFDTAAESRWKKDRLSIQLANGKLLLGKTLWQLDTALPLRLSKSSVQLGEQCWSSGESTSCLNFGLQNERLQGHWSLKELDLALLNPQMPGSSTIDGSASVDMRIAPSPLDAIVSEIRVSTSAIKLGRSGEGLDETLLELDAGQITASTSGRDVAAALNFPIAGKTGISGQMTLRDASELDGRIAIQLQDLDVITAFVPEILRADGQLAADLGFGGNIRQPLITGQLALTEGSLDLDAPEIQIRKLNLNLSGRSDTSMAITASAESGKGTLAINGDFNWRDAGPALKASIEGQRFLAVNTPEASVRVSPDLKLDVGGQDISVKGRLTIPEARIEPRSLSNEQALSPSSDQVIVGSEAPAESKYRITSKVQLVLGDSVNFAGFGLTARLAGKLLIAQDPGQAATGLGEFQLVDGHYQAYGQDLRIERGRLIFSGGSVSAPGLDVKAYRQATSSIRAGVIVRGPVRKPQVSLYSEPSMRETDQLSYLVLGRAAEAESEQDQAAINNAALALGLKGSNFLANQFKQRLGLDDVRIGSQPGQDSSQAALVLGKYLTPDVYVSYGIGLFEPIYTFKLRYELSEHWTLQTESGVEAGGDLFYTFER